MKVLSLFDGISCGRVALDRAGIRVDKYYASEIDKYAMAISKDNHADIVHLGDVTKWREWDIQWDEINLVLAGSPCQSISNLGDGSGLDGKSGLFYVFFDILQHVMEYNPKVEFILENVAGNKKALAVIDEIMGVERVMINSNAFSAQNRKRLYWTNIDIPPVEPKDIKLVDILEDGVPEASVLSAGRIRWLLSEKGQETVRKAYASIDPEKAGCLTARSDASWNSNYVTRNGELTKLTPIEYERLQTLPDNYTACVSNSQRYKAIGNGWTVDVIAHILRGNKNAK